ncbi:MAG: hypothetical protein QXW35_03500 [Candidatus Aenigmatarchaeota archaeon]
MIRKVIPFSIEKYGVILAKNDYDDYEDVLEIVDYDRERVNITKYGTVFVYPTNRIKQLTYTQPEENKPIILNTVRRMLKNYFSLNDDTINDYIKELETYPIGKTHSDVSSFRKIFKKLNSHNSYSIFMERLNVYWSKNFYISYAIMSNPWIWDECTVDKNSCLRGERYSERWNGAVNDFYYMIINDDNGRQERLLFRLSDYENGIPYGNKYGVLFHRTVLKGIFEKITNKNLDYKVIKYNNELPFYDNGDWLMFIYQ